MVARILTGNAIARFCSADGKQVVSIIGDRGVFRFIEERELWQPPADGLDGYSYWSETERSGIYASPEEALASAKGSFDWLDGSS